MALVPEVSCMEPENYKKFFRALYWINTRKIDRKPNNKLGRMLVSSGLGACAAPGLLGNPSQFAVYAAVRRNVLTRWQYLNGGGSDHSDDSDDEDQPSASPPPAKLPKITGIGLRAVFALVAQARFSDAHLCEQGLRALLDVLQGHAPEDLFQEPAEIMRNLHTMLVEMAGGGAPTGLTALGCSSLLALSVARGEAELILHAVASLVMSPAALANQYVQIPTNITTLQRSVQSYILGTPSRNLWLNYGVPSQSLMTSFPVDLPTQLTTGHGDLVVRSLVSDGCYLYVFTSKGLLKIGSGYGSSVKQHVYLYKPDFFSSDRHGWLGFCKNKLYVRIGRKKTELYEVDKDNLEVINIIRLDPGLPTPIEPKSAVFTDGNQLGLMLLTNYDNLTVRFYDVESTSERVEGACTLTSHREVNVHLLRRRTLALGRAPFEEGMARRSVELDSPVAMQLDNDDDPLVNICTGQDFGLLTTASGKVYYTGKASSLGYKVQSPSIGRWTLMKETIINRHDGTSTKKPRITQIAMGHEGVHAIMVLDSGAALFTGVARRGEDGDLSKHRRTPKPTRPKKMLKAEGHHIKYAACNYGSTALVTKHGLLLMFGKDTQHCDSAGVVTGLRHERVIQVALGKAHAVALTNFGEVYTFGINNKSQCGREFGYTKERMYSTRRRQEETRLCAGEHSWASEFCLVCVLCRECTGFSSACKCADLPNRVPRQKCGCGEGESGCSECGVCRCCADAFATAAAARPDPEDADDTDSSARPDDNKSEKEGVRFPADVGGDSERETSVKVNCLPPARIAIPGGHRVTAVSCGLHHTVLLTDQGDVLTFGSNQHGQLGAGDVSTHHRVVRVRVPRAAAMAAGSYHTAVMTRDGELYTFGSYQKGSLGRPRTEEPPRHERSPVWHAVPGRVPRLGPRHASRAVCVTACGDQTFVQVTQALLKTDTLFSSTITANGNTIVILPNRPEHAFKCITINKADGACNAWPGPEQVDFVNSLATLDPLYDVLWCYQPQVRVIKCFNILAFDSHNSQRCCNAAGDGPFAADGEHEYPSYGGMKRLEDLKNLETVGAVSAADDRPVDNLALTNMSILNQELAVPCVPDCSVTRMHAALHLLGCLDSLTYAYDAKLFQVQCTKENVASPVAAAKEEFLTVNRFESHGGGWGYSGHSIEAIRFMCDADIMLGGLGLFGGRGDYSAKIKVFDIGPEGGCQEGDGDLLAESEEVLFECPPRDKFSVLFDSPVPVVANRWYVAWACINGPSSDCGSSGQAMVISDEIGFHFKTSKKSNNGTDVNAGQIPSLLYTAVGVDHQMPALSCDPGEPIVALTRNISRKVTVPCFRSLITLLEWSWDTTKVILLDTNGQVPINYNKLTVMKHQKRLVYVIRACLRLTRSYINEVYPQDNKKGNSYEYIAYLEVIADMRNLIQGIMAEATPTCAMLPKKPGKMKAHRVCYVQFALEMINSILGECHKTVTACFHAFFPTPSLKWTNLCSLLYDVKEGNVPAFLVSELTATCAAMCASRGLRDVLQFVAPLTPASLGAGAGEARRPDSKLASDEGPAKSATVPRASHAQKPPPVPPRARDSSGQQTTESVEMTSSYTDWHLLDALPCLLDIVLLPVKQQIRTRQCGQPHDHGEVRRQERLAAQCCRLVARIVAELTHSVTDVKQEELEPTSTAKYQVTPSRFMRVNQGRAWNTGNGSPDAICFTVDRAGVLLAGVCVYGGIGTYEYELELLHDVRLGAASDEGILAHCWVSIEMAHGTFSSAECQHDMAQLKFDRPVPLKEDLRYAIRLCAHGGRTVNGDCGMPSVKGPDGTTFRFASCSLSFNGTSLARGQIPCLIYYGKSRLPAGEPEGAADMVSALRALTLRAAGVVMQRSADLFSQLRNELTAEDLRRNASVLQQSPAVNTLLPYTLASLEGLRDTKSIVHILEMVHKLLPHVAAVNHIVPGVDETTCGGPPTTTGHYYTWVESDHPYKQATVTNLRVLFPPSVSWIVLEMDPRSVTGQPEDSLTIYAVAGAPKQRCHCASEARTARPPFRKRYVQLTNDTAEVEEFCEEGTEDAPCLHYNCTYVAVTPKLANVPSEWPQSAILVPGNEVIFSLETASDYLNEYNKSNSDENRFGFRCLCVGYEVAPFSTQRQGLVALEMELAYAGAGCASRLLSPNLDIPPLSHSTLMEVQICAMGSSSPTNGEGESPRSTCEALLLARGLEISSPPTVHQVLEGQPLLRCMSTERQFLSDFVAGAESTAGGRLACWLAPAPRVQPARCELRAPGERARPAACLALPVLLRDQYGDPVASPALRVEVVVERGEEAGGAGSAGGAGRLGGVGGVGGVGGAGHEALRATLPDIPYAPTVRETMRFHAITMMKAYQGFSFEELRVAFGAGAGGGAARAAVGGAGAGGGAGRVPPERLAVSALPDGTHLAAWTPRAPGAYTLRCTLDDQPVPQELTIVVAEGEREPPAPAAAPAGGNVAPSSAPAVRVRRFDACFSAGLRVRASPSLQAEELGRVPSGSNIAFVEEVVNKDGTWLRLSAESTRAHAAAGAAVAWCLQHHRQLDRSLLVPAEPSPPDQPGSKCDMWTGYGDAHGDILAWRRDDAVTKLTRDCANADGRAPFTSFNVHSDSANSESDSSSSPSSGLEPSKQSRLARDDSFNHTPRRLQRRSNGNGGNDEWWTPEKHRSTENVHDIGDNEPPSRLAQTGTQTSPERTPKEEKPAPAPAPAPALVSAQEACARPLDAGRGTRGVSPPPPPAPALPGRAAPAPPPARKLALSPAQAECLRAIFAALLWHEGIVHDAIACAAFLKFHPRLPKAGARVVTRAPPLEPPPRPQRHSVELSSAGQYLRIHPSTLESLARRGAEASASRVRKPPADAPPPSITEEGSQSNEDTLGSTSVVNVLPPALRALVALWDALNDADQLAAATDKFKKKEILEKDENGEAKPLVVKKKREWKHVPIVKVPYTVRCDMCCVAVPPPLAAHMRRAHPGCRLPTEHGYDRSGGYQLADIDDEAPAVICGQLSKTSQLWYIFCEKCREKGLALGKPSSTKVVLGPLFERPPPPLSHHDMRENADFLLDLAPLTSSESASLSPFRERPGRSPPTPPGSMWQPAPPFQCLAALGAAPRPAAAAAPPDAARYHSLGRPPPAPAMLSGEDPSAEPPAFGPRVHRSVSMGQAGARGLAAAARAPRPGAARPPPPHPADTLSGAGSSLLAQPSASLQRLVGGACAGGAACAVSAFAPPPLDAIALMRRPALAFVLAKRDLQLFRQKLDAAVRINTVRQYAFEALNWLLRSVTQPTGVHDVMWWFCDALEQFARLVPLRDEDNKEGITHEKTRLGQITPWTSAVCPGGRAMRGARAAFHAFLGAVSALAPSLPPGSAAALQAVRCWALRYSRHDRAFLHRSQVFSVISRILSHAEDGAFEEGMLGALHESFHSYLNKENFVWTCPDVTGWCDVTASSRQGMAGALTDGSTETFWESGDEDRNKAKWIEVTYPGGTPDDRPHLVCLHIDNTRDTLNKTLLISILYSGATTELFHMQDMDIDAKSAAWTCYALPRLTCGPVRVRCELRGPEPAVRVRQVRVLSAPAPQPAPPAPAAPAHLLQAMTEADTLRVFRLLTSQVFGKLLEWERSGGSEAGAGAGAEADAGAEAAGPEGAGDDPPGGHDDSDLREHVVGILFAGHKLTSLQRQVMSHIVCAIGCEATRARDDWETALLCARAEAAERAPDATPPPARPAHAQDNYCFEMLSLLLALSGSAVGRAHLAQRTELLADLLALLHTGSERVQRQVISLLRRMIAEIPPQKMFAAVNLGSDPNTRVTLLEHLVVYLSKAISVQVKVKGGGGAAPAPAPVSMGVAVAPAPPAAWYMRGATTKKHADLVAKLLTDMAEDKVSPAWGAVTRASLAGYAARLAQLGDADRSAARCVAAPAMWLALAALCVCRPSQLDTMNGPAEGRGRGGDARPFCVNHDDGATLALVDCRSCGPLCPECDRFLHLHRAARTHHRQICKEEESAIRIDIHEGCGRAKLFWLLLLVDRRTLKALAEFRAAEGPEAAAGAGAAAGAAAALLGAGTCRFCGTRGDSGLLAIGNVCADQQCQEHGAQSCARLLACGHACGGVRGERACLPCLFGCARAAGAAPLRQDADDMCMICFTDPLQAAPAIQLQCGHVFHLHCCKQVLVSKWIGPRITFSFAQCPICKEDMDHWTLEELLAPIRSLGEEVRRKALMRLEYEGVSGPGAGRSRGANTDPAVYAMERYAYYVCHKCGKAYFGGLARCEAETSGRWEPSELVCGACSDVAGARTCPKHGGDFLEYKCRYCCSVAVFFCFGTSHFCNACHDDFQRVTSIPVHQLPHCPAGAKGEQLPGTAEECPLHVEHPATGEEFALGCGICRNAHAF